MIFVTLGTQDKGFSRLLEAIDKEIEKGNIKEKVVVQAGHTKYESSYMEIFDKYIDLCAKYGQKVMVVLTHEEDLPRGEKFVPKQLIKFLGKKSLLDLEIVAYDELTDRHVYHLFVELMGKYANVVLVEFFCSKIFYNWST